MKTINFHEAKDIAGKLFVGEFDREYLIKKKEKLCLFWRMEKKWQIIFDFGIFKCLSDEPIETKHGITVHEKDFPDILLTIAVSLEDGTTKILYKIDQGE